jgi:hypothetical protein
MNIVQKRYGFNGKRSKEALKFGRQQSLSTALFPLIGVISNLAFYVWIGNYQSI